MKILIWAMCFLVYGVVRTTLQNVGIYLGFIPTVLLYTGLFYLATRLCTMWDVKRFEKEAKQHGMTIGEYANAKFKNGFLQLCREHLYDKRELRKMLSNSVKEDVITKAESNVLFYIYDKGLWDE